MSTISFEFYPPKTDEQRAQLDRTVEKLRPYGPEYVSCTFGAGGSRAGSKAAAWRIRSLLGAGSFAFLSPFHVPQMISAAKAVSATAPSPRWSVARRLASFEPATGVMPRSPGRASV